MNENELIDYLAKYNGFSKDYKDLFPNKEETIRLLMKITLPDDLDEDFYKLENGFIAKMNSRIAYLETKKLSFKDGLTFIKHDPLSIKGDLLINPKLQDFYTPQELMKKNFNDDIIFHGGLEIRRDILKYKAKQGHDLESWESIETEGYLLPYKEIYHIYFKDELENEEDVKNFSNCIIETLKKAKENKYKTIILPLFERDLRETEHLIRLVKSYLRTSSRNLKVIFVTSNDETYDKFLSLFN